MLFIQPVFKISDSGLLSQLLKVGRLCGAGEFEGLRYTLCNNFHYYLLKITIVASYILFKNVKIILMFSSKI